MCTPGPSPIPHANSHAGTPVSPPAGTLVRPLVCLPAHPDPVLAAWLRFALEPGLPLRTALALLQRFGTPSAVYQQDAAVLRTCLPAALAMQLARAPGTELAARLAQASHWLRGGAERHALPLHHPCYPDALRQLADPPLLLYLEGNPQVLARPAIAIVGARNATPAGKQNAYAFASALASAGWVVVSGLARGIDAAAHAGALDGAPPLAPATVAVLGCGPDIIYPAAHAELARRIIGQGAILSDYPPGTPPLPGHFPRRNRLVAGLAQGTLVIEAALRSGSLVTARLAADNNREVFALPGSIHAPLARGCHALIRQGAKLVETLEDILEELPAIPPAPEQTPAQPPHPQAPPACPLSPDARRLLPFLSDAPAGLDALLLRSGMDAASASAALWELETAGLAARTDAGSYQGLAARRRVPQGQAPFPANKT
ncbi:DNA protecting protein DprA [Bordetella sp. J329]|nr:DNA-processing protein DprA [Kerstersia gyiorum]AZV92471.1 DNA protecting protein DprA [Bordetella sp. J329]MCH4270167.1 DNA-processing protein DprA [Kerstersia gyiorum]